MTKPCGDTAVVRLCTAQVYSHVKLRARLGQSPIGERGQLRQVYERELGALKLGPRLCQLRVRLSHLSNRVLTLLFLAFTVIYGWSAIVPRT